MPSDKPEFKWTEPLAQRALLTLLDPHNRNMVFPNVMIGGGEMDLAVLTKRGYLTEFEIKVSAQDWRADKHKEKWADAEARAKVKYFVYAVPIGLMNAMPEDIDQRFGIVALINHASNDWTDRRCLSGRWVRQPQVLGNVQPLAQADRTRLLTSMYHRYWRQVQERPIADPSFQIDMDELVGRPGDLV